LTALDGELTPGRVQFFAFLCDFSFILGLRGLERCDFISALLEALVEHFDLLVGSLEVCQDAIVASFQIPMRRVHII